jgi:hypothetical protein
MIRAFRPLALVSCLILMTGRVGAADDDAKALIDKAIKAHGFEKFLKLQGVQAKAKGTIYSPIEIPFTQQSSVQYPDKFKETVEGEANGQKFSVITVYDGKKGWISINGETKELDDSILAAVKEAVHLMQITRMAFQKDEKCEFSTLGEMKVNDHTALGVKISAKGHKDVNLYFDKETGLMAKAEFRTTDPASGKEFAEERIITEYQKVDGVQIPKKVLINHDGEKFMEVELIEQKFVEKIDDGEFGKP